MRERGGGGRGGVREGRGGVREGRGGYHWHQFCS
jgi:hypothetical protein